MGCDWLFVDGSSLIFRAFHGVPATVRSPDGRPVNAVRGFVDALARLVTTREPACLAVASDEDWRPAWRVELIPGYKAHRVAEPIPHALIPQMAIIHEVLAAIGIDFVGLRDYEAEDVIATWTAATRGTVEIASGDRDLFALVEDPRVIVLYPEKGGLSVIDEAGVTRRYNIPGRRYADYAILRGDPSDGLPGIKGVGSATAAQMVAGHASIDAMLSAGRFTDAQRDYLRRALRVVPPVSDLPVALPATDRDSWPADATELDALAERHGLRSSVDRLVSALAGHRPRG